MAACPVGDCDKYKYVNNHFLCQPHRDYTQKKREKELRLKISVRQTHVVVNV